MNNEKLIRILAIPGSLRANASSNLILNALISMAPPRVSIEVFQGVGNLPHFNDPQETPAVVNDFKAKVRSADAILICTPEYAFGIPGSLKNALDWTVSTGEFMDKPTGVVTAASHAEKGHAALLLTLTAIASRIIPEATLMIPFVRSKIDAGGQIKGAGLSSNLNRALTSLVAAVEQMASRSL